MADTAGQEDTLRSVSNDNLNIAIEIRSQLDSALGADQINPDSTATPISPNMIDQALDSARATRNLLRGILETLVSGIINRI